MTGIAETNRLISSQAALEKLLTQIHGAVSSAQITSSASLLGPGLNTVLEGGDSKAVIEEYQALCQSHEVFDLVMQDPYSSRAFEKPRGYAGDAVMLDYVYDGQPPRGTSQIGHTVFGVTANGSMGRSVAFRKELLKAELQATCFANPEARILSVASGHCRELAGTPLVVSETNDTYNNWEFVAIDQDPISCAKALELYSSPNVSVDCASIKVLLDPGSRERFGQFDLIYSAGLFDYLQTPLASRLVSELAGLLKPSGRLLIANFMPSCFGRAFMDLFLDWRLVYRTPGELLCLGEESGLEVRRTFEDPFRNVTYVEWGLCPIGGLGPKAA